MKRDLMAAPRVPNTLVVFFVFEGLIPRYDPEAISASTALRNRPPSPRPDPAIAGSYAILASVVTWNMNLVTVEMALAG